ncbi:cell division protein FtsW [Candidatus Gottesmanbacteria bacterium RIFCSPHIGHO2_01_FULL_43_15]|nr:MAG: cell division protein FtsW [Candidatus Gottesmanbacteria bacterium RIFCSPHIGHO2_01_FULL_43_15]
MGYDKPLLFVLIGLLLYGLVAVFNSSIVTAFRDFGNQYHFLRDQAIFLSIGLVLMFSISLIDYHIWYKLAIPLLFITLILLLSVFIPGVGIHVLGAKRWLNIGFFTLQPTEFSKLVLVIYLSAWFTYKERGRFLPFLLLLGLVIGLVMLQPDLGTTVIISSLAVVLYFVSGIPVIHILVLIPIGIVVVGLLAISAPYRFARITSFLNPNQDPLGASYHVRQILIALGSGGWFGVGLGKSRQKYAYLPEANTDSIFAIIAEETGFLGAGLLILAMAFVAYRIFYLARQAPDRFGQLLACGIGSWFAIQTLINLGAMVVLLPLTGVPLPLISYGGSNLISLLIGFGILLNIGRQSKHK